MIFMRLWPCGARRAESDPADGAFKQNRISSVSERLLGRPLGRIANGVRKHYLSYPF